MVDIQHMVGRRALQRVGKSQKGKCRSGRPLKEREKRKSKRFTLLTQALAGRQTQLKLTQLRGWWAGILGRESTDPIKVRTHSFCFL